MTFGGEGIVRRYVNGVVAWTTVLPAPGWNCGPRDYTEVVDVEIDQNGDVLLAVNKYTGLFVTPGYVNAYLVKLDGSNGVVIQEVKVGGNQTVATGVGNADLLQRPVLIGWTNDAIPGTTTIGAVDGFVVRFSTALKPLFETALKFGSPAADYPASLVVRNSSLFVSGQTYGLIAGAKKLSGSSAGYGGGADAFANEIFIGGAPTLQRTLQFGGASDEV